MNKRRLLLPVIGMAVVAVVTAGYFVGQTKRSSAEHQLLGAWDGHCAMADSSSTTAIAQAMGTFTHIEFGPDGTVVLDRNFPTHYRTESGYALAAAFSDWPIMIRVGSTEYFSYWKVSESTSLLTLTTVDGVNLCRLIRA
jgi:hypothetical protein